MSNKLQTFPVTTNNIEEYRKMLNRTNARKENKYIRVLIKKGSVYRP